MDPAALITALGAGVTAVGAIAWRFIDRADKKRERREVKVEELLKNRVATLEATAKAERKYASKVKAAAGKWREQLIAAGIAPDPIDWPEEETHE